MVTHSSILAWEIPWTEKPGGIKSKGLQRVLRHDRACTGVGGGGGSGELEQAPQNYGL